MLKNTDKTQVSPRRGGCFLLRQFRRPPHGCPRRDWCPYGTPQKVTDTWTPHCPELLNKKGCFRQKHGPLGDGTPKTIKNMPKTPARVTETWTPAIKQNRGAGTKTWPGPNGGSFCRGPSVRYPVYTGPALETDQAVWRQ